MSELLIVVLLIITIYCTTIVYVFGRPKYCWEKWGDCYIKSTRKLTKGETVR